MYSHEQINPTLDYLLAVLKLSNFFRIVPGCAYAINALPTHPDFHSALQLCLA